MEEHFEHYNFSTNPYLSIPQQISSLNANMQPVPSQLPPLLQPVQITQESVDRERLPQWTRAETAEFLSIRADLDASFMSTKRNKPLWESISARLQLKGFHRTPDQCKSKWKNLVTRFKGSEAMEDAGKQFPFYEEMKNIFSQRMDRSFVLDNKKGKDKAWNEEDEEEEEEEEEDYELELENTTEERNKKKRKVVGKKRGGIEFELKMALQAIAKQQMEMQMKWLKESEAREAERRDKEERWRQSMISLCEERMVMARRWRESEEARNARAEARAERQHSLIAAIFSKLEEE